MPLACACQQLPTPVFLPQPPAPACPQMRSELFLTGLYWVVCKAFGHSWVPPRVRYWLAQCLYHGPGGLHAGCGVAGFAWEAV